MCFTDSPAYLRVVWPLRLALPAFPGWVEGLDRDRSGTLTLDEFCSACTEMGYPHEPLKIREKYAKNTRIL